MPVRSMRSMHMEAMVSPPLKPPLTSCCGSSSSSDEEWSPRACLTGTPVRVEEALGSAGARCMVRDVQPEPVLTWRGGNGRVGDPSSSMRSSVTAAQSSATRLQLRRAAAQEGVRSDRVSNGNAIPYHLAYCCGISRIYSGLPVFYELAPPSQHGFQTCSC